MPPPGKPSRDFIALYLGIALLGCFWLVNSGTDLSEASGHFQVALQIVKHGELSFENKEVLGIKDPADSIFAVAPNGRCYGSHEIGNTLSLLPLALVTQSIAPIVVRHFPRLASPPASSIPEGRAPPTPDEQIGRVLRTYQAGLVWALIAVMFYLLLTRQLAVRAALAATCTVLMSVTSYVVFYSHSLFDGDLVALLWCLCLYFHLDYLKSHQVRHLVLSMLAGGFMVITRLTSVLLLFSVLGWCVFTWLRHPKSVQSLRHFMVAGITLLPFAAWQLWYNHLRTGHWLISPMTSGQYFQNNLDGNIWAGIAGYLFSPGKSIFVYAPLLIVAVTGFGALWRSHRAAAFHCGVGFLAWLLIHSRLHYWYGGAPPWGPRYFVSLLPILMLPLAFALPRWWASSVGRVAVIALCAWGLTLQGASTMINSSYRMLYVIDHGWYDPDHVDERFWWSPVRNEALDTIHAALENVEVMSGHRQPYAPRYSDPLGVRASNTWNNWAHRFHLMGVPDILTAALFAAFLAMALFGFAKVGKLVQMPPNTNDV